jgi:hypothetical protein
MTGESGLEISAVGRDAPTLEIRSTDGGQHIVEVTQNERRAHDLQRPSQPPRIHDLSGCASDRTRRGSRAEVTALVLDELRPLRCLVTVRKGHDPRGENSARRPLVTPHEPRLRPSARAREAVNGQVEWRECGRPLAHKPPRPSVGGRQIHTEPLTGTRDSACLATRASSPLTVVTNSGLPDGFRSFGHVSAKYPERSRGCRGCPLFTGRIRCSRVPRVSQTPSWTS